MDAELHIYFSFSDELKRCENTNTGIPLALLGGELGGGGKEWRNTDHSRAQLERSPNHLTPPHQRTLISARNTPHAELLPKSLNHYSMILCTYACK